MAAWWRFERERFRNLFLPSLGPLMTGRSSSHPEIQLPVSARLKARKETIIGLWMDRVRQDLPAASAQGESWLHHRMSKFLDRLVIALAPERLRPVSNEDPNEPSQTHGQQRSRLEEYSLQRMLREYQLLREVIFQVVEQEGPLPSTERDIILSTLEQGVAEAGARFMQSVQSRERAAEEHFRSLLEEVPHVVWFCHPNAGIEFISKEWTVWTGLSSGEGGTGQEFQQAIHPDDLPTLAGAVDKARETRGPLDMSYRVKRIDG
ncbi:MAG TPA: RsbRD N-terminal domain-containing protein, partial [Cystobacter sp.]